MGQVNNKSDTRKGFQETNVFKGKEIKEESKTTYKV